jgi:hypothetical protein
MLLFNEAATMAQFIHSVKLMATTSSLFWEVTQYTWSGRNLQMFRGKVLPTFSEDYSYHGHHHMNTKSWDHGMNIVNN